MGRRVRHLNPVQTGAVMALDSRFIVGVASGATLPTWSTRPGGADGATAVIAPTFQENVQAGNPGVLFNGTAQGMATLTAMTNPFTIFYAGRSLTAGPNSGSRHVQSVNMNSLIGYNRPSFAVFSGSSTTCEDTTIFPGELPGVGNLSVGSGSQWRMNGVDRTTNSLGTGDFGIAALARGGLAGESDNFYAFQLLLFSSVVPIPLMKRLEQASAFSFRIPIS